MASRLKDPERAGVMVVTTCRHPEAAQTSRAKAVAELCQVPYLERSSFARMTAASGADLFYVVGRKTEALRRGSDEFYVHPGMIKMKRADGASHPLVRAVRPPGAGPVERLIDGTLGMAGDALHLSTVLKIGVVGLEINPVLASLVRGGLQHMVAGDAWWGASARRVDVRCADNLAYLRELAAHAVDVVYLDPMFESSLGGALGFDVFKGLADHAPLSSQLLTEASRVARCRVVVKVVGASDPPALEDGAPAFNRRVRGGAVDYLVVEKVLENPEWDKPDLGHRR